MPRPMRKCSYCVRDWSKFLATIFLLLSAKGEGLRPTQVDVTLGLDGRSGAGEGEDHHVMPKSGLNTNRRMEIHATGSSLPDCSHACGPCFPCKRVMVSFKCSIAESCPIVYRCMCRGKYYHVPSN